MPGPWLFALRAIPWAALLTKAPDIARAAEALLSGTRSGKATTAAVDQVRSLTDRIEGLEDHDRADAKLLKQITDQIGALTTATEVVAARQRWLLTIGVLALGLAILAIVLVTVG